MTDTIFCQKLQQELPALDFEPYPGELGAKIFQTISAKAWQLWLEHQTMLINEYRLNMLEAEARNFLKEEMEKFLFGQGSKKPEGFVAPE
jgi:Fe-S cluster biosynthesis and repair protein YggX